MISRAFETSLIVRIQTISIFANITLKGTVSWETGALVAVGVKTCAVVAGAVWLFGKASIADVTAEAVILCFVTSVLEVRSRVKSIACLRWKTFLIFSGVSNPTPACDALGCVEVLTVVAIFGLAFRHHLNVGFRLHILKGVTFDRAYIPFGDGDEVVCGLRNWIIRVDVSFSIHIVYQSPSWTKSKPMIIHMGEATFRRQLSCDWIGSILYLAAIWPKEDALSVHFIIFSLLIRVKAIRYTYVLVFVCDFIKVLI